ncbi:MAG: N-acetyl-gamma-glutamyl-phosphate reductase [Porticoccaceae bacterium]|nr:MAG: N-acetyl-gamma-glutamyl-phosphate reductase [Porticoccaceae bacterium]
MAWRVFIDGAHGTTGLELRDRLAGRDELELLQLPAERRRDPEARAELLNAADLVFLCLPDDAAREAVALLAPDNERTRVLDASTAHRTAPGWVYGLPELSAEQRRQIAAARRVAVPGCHATGFALLVAPLVAAGVLPPDQPLTAFSVTGYSGGGRAMIEEYEGQGPLPEALTSPRLYALGLRHKHLPEMQAICGLAHPPLFTPIVGSFRRGMVVSVPLWPSSLPRPVEPEEVHALYADHYADEPFVRVQPFPADAALDRGFLPATTCNGTNRVELFVFGHRDQLLLAARLDNLGKGASGAAVQCMNLMLGLPETAGLTA